MNAWTVLDKQEKGASYGGRHSQDHDVIILTAYDSGAANHRCRINIHHDTSYAWQSKATLERWNGEQWHQVCRLLPEQVHAKTAAENLMDKAATILD
tara:strand:+ start:747 stop:1037 length:291 start_codon:yes stop_codon:yes gene_type:complete